MVWPAEAEINWARTHSRRRHPRRWTDRNLRVQEACDLHRDSGVGTRTPFPPMWCLSRELRASSVLPPVSPREEVLKGGQVRPPWVLSSLDIWESWLMRHRRE